MRIKQWRTTNSQGGGRNVIGFCGGLLLGGTVVMMMMTSQNQVKYFTMSDGSASTTASTSTGSTARYRPAYANAPTRGVLAVSPVQESSSSEDGDSDENDAEESPNVVSGGVGASGTVDNVSYERAYRDSGGFFDDISDESWALAKERVKTRTNYFRDPQHGILAPQQWYQENFEPDFTCTHERRIGGMGDGPKWVCDPHRLKDNDCLVYSVGSAGNFMFENAIMDEIGRHCEIHTFDPEVSGVKFGHLAPQGVNYHNWGFMSETEGRDAQAKYYSNLNRYKGTFKTMKQTIEELGHKGKVIDIFKIDCEGCEWTTYKGWFNSGATLRQILVEVHETPVDKVNDFFTGVQDAGYVTFHKEPNIQYGGGKCVEYAFLKLENSFYEDD